MIDKPILLYKRGAGLYKWPVPTMNRPFWGGIDLDPRRRQHDAKITANATGRCCIRTRLRRRGAKSNPPQSSIPAL